MFDALVKVGGSLCRQPELVVYAAEWSRLSQSYRLLWLPGGGDFADQVRAVDARFNLSDSAAHWMAILAMDQTAHLLADLMPGAALVDSLKNAAAVCNSGKAAVLAPFALLRQLNPLPHRWQITSDSIAAWLASYGQIQRLVLLKSVAGVYQAGTPGNQPKLLTKISREALRRYNIVDEEFTGILSPVTDCWLLDGSQPERLVQLLAEGNTIGTWVTN